jgi:lipopolysaccharide export system protein LptA
MGVDAPSTLPGRASPRNPLKGLRYSTLGLLALLAGAIFYLLAERSLQPHGVPLLSLETGEGVAQRALNLDVTRTRHGLPSLRVSAREALTYREGSTVLHDVGVTVFGKAQEKIEITAPLAVSGGGSSGGWSFREGVELRNEDGLRIQVPEIDYKESPPELSATGEILFATNALEGRAKGLRYLVARRHLEFLSAVDIRSIPQAGAGVRRIRANSATLDPRSGLITFRRYKSEEEGGRSLAGTSLSLTFEESEDVRRLRSVKSVRGFRAFVPPEPSPEGGEAAAGRMLTGDTLDLLLDDEGMPDSSVAEGGVRLTMGDPNKDPRTLSCELMKTVFRSGRIDTLTASGSAQLRIPPVEDPRGEVTTISATEIIIRFDEEGAGVLMVEADSEVTASHGDRTLEAPHLRYDVPRERWFLYGEGDTPARLAAGSSAITANSMEVDRMAELLVAEGEVKTVYLEDDPSGDGTGRPGLEGLLGSGEGALHAMSDRLRLQIGEKKARFTGNVRVWRGGGSIEAATVDYSEKDVLLEAHDGVVARIPVAREGEPNGGTVTISAAALRYSRDAMEASFTGGAVARTDTMRIGARRMKATGTTLTGMREMQAEGDVDLRQGSVIGEGDRLDADFAADRFTLRGDGRLVTIQDQSSQQLARGAVLTYERSTGRILVESESGGRTWITLRPKSEEGERSDPESPR